MTSQPSPLRRVRLQVRDAAGVAQEGEVVVAPTATPELLRFQAGDPGFRILLVEQMSALGLIPEPGVALCVPEGATSVGEAAAPYEMAGALHLRRDVAEAYRRGVVLLPGGERRPGAEFFPPGGDPDFQQLGALLLVEGAAWRPGPFLEALTAVLGPGRDVPLGPRTRLRALLAHPAADTLPPQVRRHLRSLAQGRAESLERLAERLYRTPEALREDVAALVLAVEDPKRYREVSQACAFLQEAVPPPGQTELERRLLSDQISFAEVARQPHRWPALAAALEGYRGQHRRAYGEHHRAVREAALQLQAQLTEAAPQVRALRLLNAIPHLGPPLGTEALRSWRALRRQVQPCSEAAPDLSGDAVRCRRCGLAATDQPAAAATRQAVADLQRALHEQLRRLAGGAVRRVLVARGREPRLDRFLQVVQASDVASLAQVMDARLARFLRDLLAEGDVVEVETSVWQEVQRQLPHLDEGETERAVEALRAALDRALAEARRLYPGRRIRLTWR